ncbi:N-6 DNA methylase [Ruegeria atlantica]|uniref:N-6 DNA methylase n=1 Tax=Ruegeria atlantica TaxID=81569 RepID=UPI002494FF03|nr:N-6 DNA methylase [Ruegeria atlantica]
MLDVSAVDSARAQALTHEANLPKEQRKRLGQHFTGLKLGRVLAHLAVDKDTRTVLDPMAGSGDLLDASAEAAALLGARLERLDGIEIDPPTAKRCLQRLKKTSLFVAEQSAIIIGDAFDEATSARLAKQYDLVITNPPFVRYQSLNGKIDSIRDRLRKCIQSRVDADIRDHWLTMAASYSGLADLSVPSWLLSAALVRPGGRLALVVPATWRTRSYADVIRYMLIRCFDVEAIVEDTQPGWFSDALVRSHLIVARRLNIDEERVSLSRRTAWSSNPWLCIAPSAASSSSLIGIAFGGDQPESKFAAWVRDLENGAGRTGVTTRTYLHQGEQAELFAQFGKQNWLSSLESEAAAAPMRRKTKKDCSGLPSALARVLPSHARTDFLVPLQSVGISIGQGLRTGCNRFFYVERVKNQGRNNVTVRAGKAYDSALLTIPNAAVRHVLHRQADLSAFLAGQELPSMVLDLRSWVLPEEREVDDPRAVLPPELAAHVRAAQKKPLGDAKDPRPASELSAVRTNIRAARQGAPARNWYMLPDFAPRHQPQAFVARILHDAPIVYTNSEPRTLIDANFSTFWTTQADVSNRALAVFLNSSWCQAMMEAMGTPLGGGALKLEAAHLRSMLVPRLQAGEWSLLGELSAIPDDEERRSAVNRQVLRVLFASACSSDTIDQFSRQLDEIVAKFVSSRRIRSE